MNGIHIPYVPTLTQTQTQTLQDLMPLLLLHLTRVHDTHIMSCPSLNTLIHETIFLIRNKGKDIQQRGD